MKNLLNLLFFGIMLFALACNPSGNDGDALVLNQGDSVNVDGGGSTQPDDSLALLQTYMEGLFEIQRITGGGYRFESNDSSRWVCSEDEVDTLDSILEDGFTLYHNIELRPNGEGYVSTPDICGGRVSGQEIISWLYTPTDMDASLDVGTLRIVLLDRSEIILDGDFRLRTNSQTGEKLYDEILAGFFVNGERLASYKYLKDW
jgi:hypothetical protein